jgi:hypothetical protein
VPLLVIMLSALTLAVPTGPDPSLARILAGVAVGVLLAVLALTAAAALEIRARRAAGAREGPRPRWQYGLMAAAWLAVAAGSAVTGLHAGDGLAAAVLARLCLCSGLYGLLLLGRALRRGHDAQPGGDATNRTRTRRRKLMH